MTALESALAEQIARVKMAQIALKVEADKLKRLVEQATDRRADAS